MMQEIVIFGIGLSGILGGYALSRIAPEEIKPGEKYFQIFASGVFVVLSLLVSYYLFISKQYIPLSLCIPLALVLLVLSLTRRTRWLYGAIYLFFGFFYFLYPHPSYNLLLASLLFLYGLPVGTLLSASNHEN